MSELAKKQSRMDKILALITDHRENIGKEPKSLTLTPGYARELKEELGLSDLSSITELFGVAVKFKLSPDNIDWMAVQ